MCAGVKFLGELVITSRIGGRNGTLVNPEQMYRSQRYPISPALE
jgi:hypothetical protein